MNKIIIGEEFKYGSYDKNNDVLTININKPVELDISNLKNKKIVFNISCNNVNILNINSIIKNIVFDVNQNCSVEIYNFNSNDNSYDIDVSLKKDSSIKVVTSTLSNKENNVNITINHNEESSKSICINNGVVKEGSISYDVKGIVNKGALNSEVEQSSKIISCDISKASIKPILVIDDSVNKASHAASIGSYQQDVLFYMECRGINKDEGIKILNKGLLSNNFKYIDEISDLI